MNSFQEGKKKNDSVSYNYTRNSCKFTHFFSCLRIKKKMEKKKKIKYMLFFSIALIINRVTTITYTSGSEIPYSLGMSL